MTRHVRWSRTALDDLKAQIAYIAIDSPAAARQVADRVREAAAALRTKATGRPGRVQGTFEKLVPGLPYIVAFAVQSPGGAEIVTILRVIHTARDWPAGRWPQ